MTTPRPAPALLALAIGLGAAAHAMAQPVLRIYDARDLAAALPQPVPNSVRTDDLPVLTLARAVRASATGSGESAAQASATDVVVTRLCAQLGLESERLMDGVYVVKGEQAAQDQFGTLLDKTRALYLGAYEVELTCTVFPAASAPAIGTAPESGSPLIRIRQIIARRVETAIVVTERQSYIEDWTPVVGADSVGYDPQVSQIERGLQVTVLVGAGPDAPVARADGKPETRPDAMVPIVLRGQISDARVEPFKAAQAEPPGTVLEIGLPRTQGRSIVADTRLSQGKAMVVAVVPGFTANESIAIAVAVRELK